MRIQTHIMSFEQALNDGAIEDGVKPLVEALNVHGVSRTFASCHGHPTDWQVGGLLGKPYVAFFATPAFAQKLTRMLEGLRSSLHQPWQMVGQYHWPDFELIAWTLEPTSQIAIFDWDHADVRTDLLALAAAVDQMREDGIFVVDGRWEEQMRLACGDTHTLTS